jgi:hypothetical protein
MGRISDPKGTPVQLRCYSGNLEMVVVALEMLTTPFKGEDTCASTNISAKCNREGKYEPTDSLGPIGAGRLMLWS